MLCLYGLLIVDLGVAPVIEMSAEVAQPSNADGAPILLGLWWNLIPQW